MVDICESVRWRLYCLFKRDIRPKRRWWKNCSIVSVWNIENIASENAFSVLFSMFVFYFGSCSQYLAKIYVRPSCVSQSKIFDLVHLHISLNRTIEFIASGSNFSFFFIKIKEQKKALLTHISVFNMTYVQKGKKNRKKTNERKRLKDIKLRRICNKNKREMQLYLTATNMKQTTWRILTKAKTDLNKCARERINLRVLQKSQPHFIKLRPIKFVWSLCVFVANRFLHFP